jgi:hypothetical protein
MIGVEFLFGVARWVVIIGPIVMILRKKYVSSQPTFLSALFEYDPRRNRVNGFVGTMAWMSFIGAAYEVYTWVQHVKPIPTAYLPGAYLPEGVVTCIAIAVIGCRLMLGYLPGSGLTATLMVVVGLSAMQHAHVDGPAVFPQEVFTQGILAFAFIAVVFVVRKLYGRR